MKLSLDVSGNDTAFPLMPSHTPPEKVARMHTGLTKREYFAVAAMQGLCVNQPDHFETPETERKCRIATLALQAVEHADALIAELNK